MTKDHIPLLDEAQDNFLESFAGDEEASDDPMEQLLSALSDPDMIREMPDELLFQLAQMADIGSIPEEISVHVRRECEHRAKK